MRALLVGLPVVSLAAVVQSTLLNRYHFYDGGPDLVLLIILSWTLSGDALGGILWGFMGGLCLDLFSGGPFGAAPLSLVLLAYVAGLTEERFWGSHILL